MLRALAERGNVDVTMVTAHDLLPHRQRMGWTEPDFGAVRRLHRPDEPAVSRLIEEHRDADSLHVFSGIQAFPPVYAAFRRAIRTDARIGVVAIQPEPRGVRAIARRLLYCLHALRYGKRIDLVLAVGEEGARWFRSVGFRDDRVCVFGNFSDVPATPEVARPPDAPFSLLFVGELIERKRVDVLLRALAAIKEPAWRLEIIGDGPVGDGLRTLASDLGLQERVHWSGYQPHEVIHARLALSDLLVLPSRFDGWGSVVNEAVTTGVPVVCSDTCGASDVVRACGRGHIFPAGDVAALRAALDQELRRGPAGASDRHALSQWASRLSPESGARYLEAILRSVFDSGPRPIPPWLAA